MIRILSELNQDEIRKVMTNIGADSRGIKIMLPKAVTRLIKINSISNIAANILKQEMLSLGADAAIARGALTGKVKKTDCLLMGNLSQFKRLSIKLREQPFGLREVGGGISQTLKNHQKKKWILNLGRHKLNLSEHTKIMGIINLTPDSFSGDGLYSSFVVRRSSFTDRVVDFAKKMIQDGADIIDIGGESTRPGAKSVSAKEELKRVVPVIKILAKKIKTPISIDTYKSEVAQAALDNGAVIVNDITGLKNNELARVIARYKAGVVIMHKKGTPQTMQINPRYRCLITDILEFLQSAINRALTSGIDKEKIIIDPGIGFGKTFEHNLETLKNLSDFKVLDRPILVGASRKSFIGKILNTEPRERSYGTTAVCVLAAKAGAQILRVHDVKQIKQALMVAEAILRQTNAQTG